MTVPPAPVPVEPGDTQLGCVVLMLNAYGVAVAYGPYGEMEAHDFATFLEQIALAVWVLNLDDNPEMARCRYTGGEEGPFPLTDPPRPETRPE